jgi:hypothetical protein
MSVSENVLMESDGMYKMGYLLFDIWVFKVLFKAIFCISCWTVLSHFMPYDI